MSLSPALIEKKFSITVPPGYKNQDFYEFIQKVCDFTKMQVKDGRIRMAIVSKYFIFEKSGKWYGMHFLVLLGLPCITIEEITDNNAQDWRDVKPKKLLCIFMMLLSRIIP